MYLNLLQLAESFGVSESVVEDWVAHEGLPHVRDRDRLLFDRAQVADWASRRGLAARAGFLAPEPVGAGPSLEALLRRGGLWRDVPAGQVLGVFEQVLRRLPGAAPALLDLVIRRLHEPGGIAWAPVGDGMALPHLAARVTLGPDTGCLAALWLREPLAAAPSAPDATPVTRLLFFLAPTPRAHLDLLARLSRALRGGPLREALLAGAADEAVYQAARAADALSGGGAANRETSGGGR